jgi:hypothetical protein
LQVDATAAAVDFRMGFAGGEDSFDLGHDEFLEECRVSNRFKSHAM